MIQPLCPCSQAKRLPRKPAVSRLAPAPFFSRARRPGSARVDWPHLRLAAPRRGRLFRSRLPCPDEAGTSGPRLASQSACPSQSAFPVSLPVPARPSVRLRPIHARMAKGSNLHPIIVRRGSTRTHGIRTHWVATGLILWADQRHRECSSGSGGMRNKSGCCSYPPDCTKFGRGFTIEAIKLGARD